MEILNIPQTTEYNYPIDVRILLVIVINIISLGVTYVLFHWLRSSANIKIRRWRVGGAIGGYVILVFSQLILVDHFSCVDKCRPSYKVVESFYGYLQEMSYSDEAGDKAWALLDTKLQNQKKWRGDKSVFKDGFKYTKEIALLSIMRERGNSQTSDVYIIYYVDRVDSPIIPGLDHLTLKRIKDIGQLAKDVADLRNTIRATGFDVDVFDNISLRLLMAPNRAIVIGWALETAPSHNPPQKKFDDVFPQRRTIDFITASRAVTQNTPDGWKIVALSPLGSQE